MPAAVDPAHATSAPDWTAIVDEVFCPLCDYNLRGLTEPRCPECGYQFAWPELLDRRLREHPFLFEHHPRRNIVSFVKTLLAGWMPRRFWRTLTARHEIHPRRLRWYAVLAIVMPFLLAGTGLFSFSAWQTATKNAQRAVVAPRLLSGGGYGYMYKNGELWIQAYHPFSKRYAFERVNPPWNSFDFAAEAFERMAIPLRFPAAVLALLAWPCVTFATLMIFRDSMRLANVKRMHVIRCVVYSFDCIAIVAIASLLWRPSLQTLVSNDTFDMSIGPMLMLFPLAWYRLGSAYSRYLRFDRPYATALASQVITFLAIAAVVVYAVE
ncbi:MAG TPA: hypothetical protein VLI90_18375 [Tepidisphaeraceae bacterium]|nr:hypothetical protein [Tepidisphaeraceae bacterium]